MPEYLEAELIVEITYALSTYLGKKFERTDSKNKAADLPFCD